MRLLLRTLALSACALGVLAFPLVAAADHATRPHTANIHAKGHSPHVSSFEGLPDGVRHINSDIAFWGNLAFNGNYNGWRVIDISDPDNPVELAHPECNGDQGDLVVWKNILVRSWNSPKTVARTCLGTTVPAGWEGVHVFDISDPVNPTLEASVELECGSHTVTVAGVSGGNLIVYSNISSSTNCVVPPGAPPNRALDDPAGDYMDIIAVPLANPAGASLLRREPLAGPTTNVRTGCHDAAVIRGSVNLAACASADTVNVWDIGDNDTEGGSIEDPELIYTIFDPNVGTASTNGRWHSAAFTWDGKVLVLGWEPGGGGLPECEESDPAVKKSMFFYDVATGTKLGQWTLPRAQSSEENCTIHNYNIVPTRSGRYLAVSGNYQAGTWVTDFTDPASPVTVAWSDPPALGQVVDPNTGQLVNELGGAWSSYWYNNFIYESEITKGVNVFRASDPRLAGALRLGHLNPQTEEFSLD
jgi:hypothetical protein